ncbi:peptidoglycan/LPS O-acetylase OafA/YrhL [Hymenobacter luteus]|uniref:Peptidoglycan/LPS O-acetylase OafA/YrhL n=2 Tax=Hymenobacter TaxID=89966 RepID=A0A7W9SXR2_9BACT|nr:MULTISPECIES: acyltransferase [Hymenobacter]MBB4600049.1 peptidoglycan/LPS O-acetylase OafA/YrhL [Hymenobacter latericoloratus]MBB6057641.1 peptidoglycan/LPS O-acetylase OafA/YrhL [Hymenobacter luteus]
MQNNFDAVRLGLALTVVLCHLAVLSEVPAFQPFLAVLSADFAVKGFFVISGCLVTRSFLSSASGREYAEKRVRRIYPAYLVTLGLAWLIGLVATTLPVGEYLGHPATYRYLGANAIFLNFLQPTLPGVFGQQPVPVLNGSLWTIKVELCLYACVPVLVWLCRRLGPYPAVGLVYVGALAWGWLLPCVPGLSPRAVTELSRQFPGMLHFFALGALFTLQERRLGPWLGGLTLIVGVAFLLLRHHALREVLEPVCYASLVLFLATRLPAQLPVGKWGDVSYGVYLVHFPLIQLFVYWGVFASAPWQGLSGVLLLILLVAFGLWHLVEKRWLRRSARSGELEKSSWAVAGSRRP